MVQAGTTPGHGSTLGSTKTIILFLIIAAQFAFLHLFRGLFSLTSSSAGPLLDGSASSFGIPNDEAPPSNTNNNTTAVTLSAASNKENNNHPSGNNNAIIGRNAVLECNDAPGTGSCRGFFEYSGPNHSPNATDILFNTAALYRYSGQSNEDGHLIFFPNYTRSDKCVIEWIAASRSGKWRMMGMSSHSEDVTIFNTFFKDQKYVDEKYVYMEIGAHDGVRESNTRFFDLCMGWQGLLVEPHPANYKLMVDLRPNAHHLGMAPSCNSSDVVLFPRHRLTNAVANQSKGAELEIHCGPLSYYLHQLGIRHVHFWSLDVEGSELNVLNTVDFDKVHIDVILAESKNRLAGKDEMVQEVRMFLWQKGYLLLQSVVVKHSDVFLHRSACQRYDDSFRECKNPPPLLQSTN